MALGLALGLGLGLGLGLNFFVAAGRSIALLRKGTTRSTT